MQITIDESLKTNINQYLEIIDLIISTEQLLIDTEIVQLILEEQYDKIRSNDKINQEHYIISTNEVFNSFKTWL